MTTRTTRRKTSADSESSDARLKLEIRGAVQGVGFRPFVYRLAREHHLTGWILNDSGGVFLEVEGTRQDVEAFQSGINTQHPPRAVIHKIDAEWLSPTGYTDFTIRHSDSAGEKTVVVLPDIATCEDCLVEVLDQEDRRYDYPFTNCTNCGPRFTIVQALPYDRPNTTMRRFLMCADCLSEYEDPLDRRFHAQPNACPVCGPTVQFWDAGEELSDAPADSQSFDENAHAVAKATRRLEDGAIVALKGLGGFQLLVDAGQRQAVDRLRRRKTRYEKPLALMVADIAMARTLCDVSPEAESALLSPEAPIVLLPRIDSATAAESVAPGNPYLGLMLPSTPLHHLLLRRFGKPVVATSGNLSDEPICIDNDEALKRLRTIADHLVVHDRPIERHADDSVVSVLCDAPRLIRRARGYAPLPVILSTPAPTLLAVGAHLKNTIALSVGDSAFISQHIGDMETPEAMNAFERVIDDFLRLYEADPVAVVHDLHPDYWTTRWATRVTQSSDDQDRDESGPPQGHLQRLAGLPLIPVQHHHAHLAASLAEHDSEAPALGVSWDGTGYGEDGTIWGGEFLSGDAAAFDRLASLRPFRLPGGDAAVKEPRRTALALLWDLLGDEAIDRTELAPVDSASDRELDILATILRKGLRSPVTTSAGRLFDGVAALLGLHQKVSFEGQAAMALEYVADPETTDAYPLPLETVAKLEDSIGGAGIQLDWRPTVASILEDLQRGTDPGIIAARFHNALIAGIVEVARVSGQQRVALSGGCFQNRLLTEGATDALRKDGLTVLLHREVPPNDGGISLGQIAVAAAKLART